MSKKDNDLDTYKKIANRMQEIMMELDRLQHLMNRIESKKGVDDEVEFDMELNFENISYPNKREVKISFSDGETCYMDIHLN